MITKLHYGRLMSESETGNVTVRAMKTDMSRPTARKDLETKRPPDELQTKHTWRTRGDRLETIWPAAEAMLQEASELSQSALGAPVSHKHPRSFQRRVKAWQLEHGPVTWGVPWASEGASASALVVAREPGV